MSSWMRRFSSRSAGGLSVLIMGREYLFCALKQPRAGGLTFVGRLLSVPATTTQYLFSLSPSDGERAGVRGRARPCCQWVFPLSPSDGEGRGEGPCFLRPVGLTRCARLHAFAS